MLVHRGGVPVFAFVAIEIRQKGGPSHFFVKQEYPQQPVIFDLNGLFDTLLGAQLATEAWVTNWIEQNDAPSEK